MLDVGPVRSSMRLRRVRTDARAVGACAVKPTQPHANRAAVAVADARANTDAVLSADARAVV